jgi:3-deoxy-manno-octulosonate cytidylyltransferase (CMP-KDO synthetase)
MTPVLIVIPARLKAMRLPDKPLADICGAPMIAHVWRRAMESGAGRVLVATDSDRIAAAIRDEGGEALLTSEDHPSGSDRVFEAVETADPGRAYDVVVNLQGDLPTLDPALVRTCAEALQDADIATLVTKIADGAERDDPNVVKAVLSETDDPARFRALYFTRAAAPWGEGPLWHHIGIYAWRRTALARFVALPPSPLERRERLEQLRALEAGMTIAAARVDAVPFGVDTPADLTRARAILSGAAAPTSPEERR